MIKVSSYIRLVLIAVVVTAMAAMQSCSNKDATALLDSVGNDAQCVCIVRPQEVLKSLDVKKSGDDLQFPAWMGARTAPGSGFLSDVLAIKGYDTEMVAVAVYSGNNYCLVNITDEGDFTKSLKEIGFKKESGTTNPTYMRQGAAVVIKDKTAWIAYNYNGSSVLTGISDAIKAAEKPLDAWKVEKLKADAESAVSVLAFDQQTDLTLSITVDFEGSAMTAKAVAYDLNGKSRDLAPADAFATLDERALKVGAADNVAIAIASPLSFKWTDLILPFVPYDGDLVSLDDLKTLTGSLYLSANCDKLSDEFSVLNFKNWQLYMGLGTDGTAKKILDKYAEYLASMGLNVSNAGAVKKVAMPGVFSLNAQADGQYIEVFTDNAAKTPRLSKSDISDCVALAYVNIPSDFVFFKSAGIQMGLEGKLSVKRTEAHLSLKFTDTQCSFLNAVGSSLNAIQLY